METPCAVRLYMDDGGWRGVVAISSGGSWVTYLDPTTHKIDRMDRRVFSQWAEPMVDPDKALKRAVRRVIKKRAVFNRLGVPYPKKTVARALKKLEGV
jgi:hypothetical protein